METLAELLDLFAIPGTGRVGTFDGEQDVVEEFFSEVIGARHAEEHSRQASLRLSS